MRHLSAASSLPKGGSCRLQNAGRATEDLSTDQADLDMVTPPVSANACEAA
jgi:hypothetical protein